MQPQSTRSVPEDFAARLKFLRRFVLRPGNTKTRWPLAQLV